jgi:hypothetical protein
VPVSEQSADPNMAIGLDGLHFGLDANHYNLFREDAQAGCSRMSSRPPAFDVKTMSSKPIPRSARSFAFFRVVPGEVLHRHQRSTMCAFKAHISIGSSVRSSTISRSSPRGSSRPSRNASRGS